MIVVPGQQLQYVISMLAAYAGGFVLTYFFGIDDSRIDAVYGKNDEKPVEIEKHSEKMTKK